MGFVIYAADFLRVAGVLQLLFACVLFVRDGWGAGRYAALFCFSIACYLLAGFGAAQFAPVFWYLILGGAFSVSFAFWILAQSIFRDGFEAKWYQIGFFVLLEGISFLAFGFADSQGTFSPLKRVFPQALYAGLIVLALFQVYRGLAADLIESRRKLRRTFMLTSGVYMLGVLIAEIAWKGTAPPRLLDASNVILICSLVFFFSTQLFQLRPVVFLEGKSYIASEGDRVLAQKIESLMVAEKPYRQEELNVKMLAGLLNEQEYKVRRAINGTMNYRNFYDFLNHYRIEEARGILANPTNDSIPVLRIAMDCGYGSLAPFNRAFKALTGKSPTEFRKTRKA